MTIMDTFFHKQMIVRFQNYHQLKINNSFLKIQKDLLAAFLPTAMIKFVYVFKLLFD